MEDEELKINPTISAVNRVGGMAIVAMLLVTLVPGFISESSASGFIASTQTQLSLHRPYANGIPSNAWINQTLSTVTVDDFYELSLAANVDTISLDGNPEDNAVDMSVKVVAAGNSRHSIYYDHTNAPFVSETVSITYMGEVQKNGEDLGDNDGVWIDATMYDQLPIHYFGAWYDKIFVCSNGYLILGSSDHYQNQPITTNPLPSPSDDDVNVIVAPLWRDLIRADIYWGFTSDNGFAIQWVDARDLLPYTKTPSTAYHYHTFAVVFYPWSAYDEPREIEFFYTEVHPDETLDTFVGIKDQSGNEVVTIDHTEIDSGEKVAFMPELDNCMRVIDGMKLTAWKDNYDTSITIVGVDQVDENDNIVAHLSTGGINLELDDQAGDDYLSIKSEEAALAGTSLALAGLGLGMTALFPPAGAAAAVALFIGAAGFGVNEYQFLGALSQQPESVETDAELNTYYATVDSNVLDERLPSWSTDNNWFTWDAAMFPVLNFHIPDASMDYEMWIKVEMSVRNLHEPYGTDSITTEWLKITYNGDQYTQQTSDTGIDFLGRTIPDGHYNLYDLEYPLGEGNTNEFMYRMDSSYRPASEFDYDMLGWSRLTNSFGLDYLTRPDGTIRVEGQFSISDDFTQSDSRRGLTVYVLKSGDMATPMGKETVSFIDVANDELTNRAIIVDGLDPSQRVKIGIGRYIYGPTDYHQTVMWGNEIQVFDENLMRLHVSIPTDHGCTIDPDCTSSVTETYTYDYSKTIHAVADDGYMLDHWVFNGAMVYPGESFPIDDTDVTATATNGGKDGEINFRMKHDYELEAHFVQVYELVVTSGLGGTTNPVPSTYYYEPGSPVMVNAIPNTNYVFDHWVMNGVTYTDNPRSFSISTNTNLAAYFTSEVLSPTITVLQPNGGETWIIAQPAEISWTSTNIAPTEYVKIQLVRGETMTTILASTPNDGYYGMSYLSTYYTGANDYRIRISLVDDPTNVYDESDGDFTIIAEPSPPQDLAGIYAGGGNLYLYWDHPTSDGGISIWKYHVYRALKSKELVYTRIGSNDYPDVTYTDSVLPGKTYYYYVVAENQVGFLSEPSNVFIIKIPRN